MVAQLSTTGVWISILGILKANAFIIRSPWLGPIVFITPNQLLGTCTNIISKMYPHALAMQRAPCVHMLVWLTKCERSQLSEWAVHGCISSIFYACTWPKSLPWLLLLNWAKDMNLCHSFYESLYKRTVRGAKHRSIFVFYSLYLYKNLL